MSLNVRRLSEIASLLAICTLLSTGQPNSALAAPSYAPAVELHVVQAGETLDSIASAYHVSPARLAEVNNITNLTGLAVGTRLVIPHNPGYGDSDAGGTIIVGFGDDLDVLAEQHNVSETDLGLANKVVRADMIFAGQTLVIPPMGTKEINVSVARISASTPVWKAALAANVTLVGVSLNNHYVSAGSSTPGSLVRMSNTLQKDNVLPSPWVELRLKAAPLEPGRSGSLDVITQTPGTLTGTFLGRNLNFVTDTNKYATVIGVERWTRPGLYPLVITFTDSSGVVFSVTRNVLIERGNYASEILKLSEEAAAARSDPQVVADELAYLTQKMSGFTPQRYWNGLFQIPTPGILTSAFGSVRSINGGGYDSYHAGNDFAITSGTPIYAPADGVVVDTGLLEVRGYATIIDHGMGVYTGYWHQAGILVHPGDKVTTGQQIGVVGDTGSSTASHLHWEMWVGGVPVDSLQWVREVFP